MDDHYKAGIYQHYKGSFYLLENVARHSETEELFAVYRPMYGKRDLWIRPLEMFIEKVKYDGNLIPRFSYYCEESQFED